MADYLLRLALLLPLLGALVWGSLRLTRALQGRLVGVGGEGRALRLVETSLVAPGLRLAVVRFHDREILIGASRGGLVRLGEAPARNEAPPAAPTVAEVGAP
ncbi:flagellar biosynthetic protein FliO [Erythrobacter sp.]|uniref:flagellar biosynthetic protein FliO n=1 Tax=Erythrobacter sp. TaxID=1042 RepID=UPI001425EBB5|nr:flagellar biosynthetic protein FliO [Erythrobacter sp.]QIQ87125.1 MAG: flagellar biosynthetic protein FliO [Erythrobacter sp.]